MVAFSQQMLLQLHIILFFLPSCFPKSSVLSKYLCKIFDNDNNKIENSLSYRDANCLLSFRFHFRCDFNFILYLFMFWEPRGMEKKK